MDTDDLLARMEKAKAEMEHAQEEMLKNAICNEKFRRFIKIRGKYWQLANEWLPGHWKRMHSKKGKAASI